MLTKQIAAAENYGVLQENAIGSAFVNEPVPLLERIFHIVWLVSNLTKS